MCGSPLLDLSALEDVTAYDGYSKGDSTVRWGGGETSSGWGSLVGGWDIRWGGTVWWVGGTSGGVGQSGGWGSLVGGTSGGVGQSGGCSLTGSLSVLSTSYLHAP